VVKNTHTIKKSTEALLTTSKETGLGGTAHEQNAQQNCNTKVADQSFEIWRSSGISEQLQESKPHT